MGAGGRSYPGNTSIGGAFARGDGFRFILDDKSWLLIRFSGTEPILRIYAETSNPELVAKLLEEGRALTGV